MTALRVGEARPRNVAPPHVGERRTEILQARDHITPLFHTIMTPYGVMLVRTDRRPDIIGLPAGGGEPGVGVAVYGGADENGDR